MYISDKDRSALFRDAKDPLPTHEEHAYLHLAKFSDKHHIRNKARDMVIRSHHRFLGGMALRWGSIFNIEPAEFMAEGALYLNRAIDNFDMSKKDKIKFLSYAAWYVRHAFQEVVRKSRPVFKMKDEDIKKIMRLDMPIPGDEGASDLNTYGDLLPDMKIEDAVDASDNKEEALSLLKDLMVGMTDRSKKIMFDYYGLEGREATRNTRELAEDIGTSHQYVAKAIDTSKRFMQRKLRAKTKDT